MTIVDGCLERLTTSQASGWIRIGRQNQAGRGDPVVSVKIGGKLFLTGKADLPRPDITNVDSIGYGFSLVSQTPVEEPIRTGDVDASVEVGGLVFPVSLYEPAELAWNLAALDLSGFDALIESLDVKTRRMLRTKLGPPDVADVSKHTSRSPLCVITYAQDSSAWFEYFLQYYSSIVGRRAIYVVTPKPDEFVEFKLGGVVSAENMSYDDQARASFVSNLASGLHAYYEWTLVCDVDEIIIPNPNSKMSFFEALAASDRDVEITRGFDILQSPSEFDFDPTKPVLEQRRYGVPNRAICKPHLARVAIRYSGGYHYFNGFGHFAPTGEGFMTLHLKWACRRMRAAVQEMVKRTSYTDGEIAQYAHDSVEPTSDHYLSLTHMFAEAGALDSDNMRRFEEGYYADVVYAPSVDLCIGQHSVGNFLVDFQAPAIAKATDKANNKTMI